MDWSWWDRLTGRRSKRSRPFVRPRGLRRVPPGVATLPQRPRCPEPPSTVLPLHVRLEEEPIRLRRRRRRRRPRPPQEDLSADDLVPVPQDDLDLPGVATLPQRPRCPEPPSTALPLHVRLEEEPIRLRRRRRRRRPRPPQEDLSADDLVPVPQDDLDLEPV